MSGLNFGRLWKPDPRDKNYPIRRDPRANKISRRIWGLNIILDQGTTPQCVGYSGAGYLMAAPVRNKRVDPYWLYKLAQKYDEWPGENYDGSSVRGLFKGLHKEGYVTEYRWAFEVGPVLDHVLLEGPVVVGTSWFDGMMNLDSQGYIWPRGREVGGHAYLIIGADRVRKNPDGTTGAFRIVNSWGRSWGQQGRAWVTFDIMDKLLRNQGESATATEVCKDGICEL